MKATGISVHCISRFLQLSPQSLQQMKFTKITKLVGELSAQEQYNKSWSTRIMRHPTKSVGHWFETGETKYFFADVSKLKFWSFDLKRL